MHNTPIKNTRVCITPNHRLAATLLKKYHQAQINQGHTCWPTPKILPLNTWVQHLWSEYCANTLEPVSFLLNAQQELILWEETLLKFPDNGPWLQLTDTAELAKAAWIMLKQWQVSLDHPLLKLTEDSRTFLSWAFHFQKTCQKNGWLDIASLMDTICHKMASRAIPLPSELVMTGFTELTPQQNFLLSQCEQAGCTVTQDELILQEHAAPFYLSLCDEETEIFTMARWAKGLLQQEQTPAIACVVPNLDSIRDKILAVFSTVFSDDTEKFNISAGKNLATWPVIHAALQLLGMATQSHPLAAFSSLLRSPFIGEAEREQFKRAEFDWQLRQYNIAQLSLSTLLNPTKKLRLSDFCPRLAGRLEKFLTLLNQKPRLLAVSEWAAAFMEWLDVLGWPGERSMNSHEYQAVQRWLELLSEYQTYDTLLSQKNHQDALHYLTLLTRKVIFQPQSPDAPVQILGSLEAAGLPFDHLWVMGLDDTAWPPPARANPFLPHRLQKMLNMPHATAEREFQYSARLTEQWTQNAKNSIFSCPEKNHDTERRPSPLISPFKKITPEQLILSDFTPPAEQSFKSRKLESCFDSQAPILMDTQIARGGSAIFKKQAACPFKAFAEIRLHGRPPEPVTLGLRTVDRGNITHKALEFIWREIQNSENLLCYETGRLENLLHHSIQEAIHITVQIAQGLPGSEQLPSRYLTIEAERLQRLLWQWLQLEKTRPFFKVIAQEQEYTAPIGPLSITLRIDRIDELADGSQLIIDYKTGKNNHLHHWFGERLEAPQLPLYLYCMQTPEKISGIAFAEIEAGSLKLKGISRHELEIPSIKPLEKTDYYHGQSWKEQLEQWQATLIKLGHDFFTGLAAVDPKDPLKTCRSCHLQPLCRIYE